MKRLIKEVTVNTTANRVHTTYEFKGKEYEGFTVHNTLEEAIKEAEKMIKIWDRDFMSVVDKYELV